VEGLAGDVVASRALTNELSMTETEGGATHRPVQKPL